MTDPFFQKSKNTVSIEQNEILKQELKELKDAYDQLYSFLDKPETSQEQKEQIKQKLQDISAVYTQKVSQSPNLPQDISQFNNKWKNTKIITNKSRIGVKWVVLGCSIFFVILVGVLSWVFYYLINNPSQLDYIGISAQVAQGLLQTFTTIFFWLIVFAWFGLLITNIYRLFTVKNKSKLTYIFGSFVGLIFLIWWVTFGIILLDEIANISPDDISGDMLVRWYAVIKDGKEIAIWTNGFTMIAPIATVYQLNTTQFQNKTIPKLWNVDILSLQLDCWNWTMLNLNNENNNFDWVCFFEKKGDYSPKLFVSYTSNNTNEKLSTNIDLGTITIPAEVSVKNDEELLQSNQNELVAWKAPIKISFDAADVFTSLNLKWYEVSRDFEWDGVWDKKDLSEYDRMYTQEWVTNVFVQFSENSEYIYSFPIRIEQPEVPILKINTKQLEGNKYLISTEMVSNEWVISNYLFEIWDTSTNKQISSERTSKSSLTYTFPGEWSYMIIVTYITDDGKKATIESNVLEIGQSDFNIYYSMLVKTTSDPVYKNIDLEQDTIVIDELPALMKLSIDQIEPSISSSELSISLDGVPLIISNDIAEFKIQENKEHSLVIQVENEAKDMATKKEIIIEVKRSSIIPDLTITPDTVGNSPFSVKFDASTTTLNDDDDEIVYFTWDFGDGDLRTNTSTAVMSHVYSYDEKNDIGEFYPKLTIKTKKGLEYEIGSGTLILVKRPTTNISIRVDSHPSQIANVGDQVKFILEFDGNPQKIYRDFGDDRTYECEGRECNEIGHIYGTKWTYNIIAKVSFADKGLIQNNIKLIVQ